MTSCPMKKTSISVRVAVNVLSLKHWMRKSPMLTAKHGMTNQWRLSRRRRVYCLVSTIASWLTRLQKENGMKTKTEKTHIKTPMFMLGRAPADSIPALHRLSPGPHTLSVKSRSTLLFKLASSIIAAAVVAPKEAKTANWVKAIKADCAVSMKTSRLPADDQWSDVSCGSSLPP